MSIPIVFKFANVGGVWTFSFVSATATAENPSPNIPSNSVVNREDGGCFTSTVSDTTRNAVDSVDFSAVSNLVEPLFAQIPSTGKITPDIAFEFAEQVGPGAVGLSFPNSAGVLAGVDGVASYQGVVYTAPNPPALKAPDMPTDNHLAYNVSDYTLDSLLWAFFKAGSLTANVTSGNIPDPEVLNTEYFAGTPLQALEGAYPNKDMTASIKATSAPTVTFRPIYSLSSAAYAKLAPPTLPDKDTYQHLAAMVNKTYLTEPDFYTALVNNLGPGPAGAQQTIIEGAALINAAVVTHANQVVLNVIVSGTPTPVVTFDVAQTDVLDNFTLGVSGQTQTLRFAFVTIPSATTTTFVSSTIRGINEGNFAMEWRTALEPVYALVVDDIGQKGVPLPRIPGFDFVFSGATVTIEPGWVNVLTDVQHVV